MVLESKLPRDGSGNYSLPQPAYVNGTTIDATAMNFNLSDIAAALTGSVPRDGEAAPTANVPMGGFKFTGLGAPTAAGQAVVYAQPATLTDLTTTGNTVLGSTAANTLNVGANGLVKDASGNIGFGTVTPNIYAAGTNRYVTNSASTGYAIGNYVGAATQGGEVDFGDPTTRHGALGSVPGSHLVVYTNATNSGTIIAERARFPSVGGFIVGGMLPASASGGGTSVVSVDATTTSVVDLNLSGVRTGTFQALSTDVRVNAVANLPLNFYTNNTLRATINAAGGQTLTGDTTALGVSISRSKSATTSRASTTVNADDPHLIAPLSMGIWAFEIWLSIWGTVSGAGGYKQNLAFTGTAANAFYALTGVNASLQVGGGPAAIASQTSYTGVAVSAGVAGGDYMLITGTINVSVAGNFSVQWSQNASNANATNVGIGSWMSCTKVG